MRSRNPLKMDSRASSGRCRLRSRKHIHLFSHLRSLMTVGRAAERQKYAACHPVQNYLPAPNSKQCRQPLPSVQTGRQSGA